MERVILHCDLNNFYASVETVLHHEYKNKPIAVCGDPKKRHGIVLAKSQPAKIMGVKTGDAVWEAQSKCPNLIVVPPTFTEYVKYSKIVFDIYTCYTDKVEHFGMDECWLDVTESIKMFGSGKKIADEIRERVKAETSLTISVGVSFTKTFAKLGSDLKKPDATTVISKDNYKQIVWPLDLGEMLMIGRSTVKKLNKLNVYTLGDLAKSDRELLRTHFGVIADKIINSANGLDDDPVKYYYDIHIPKSVGHGTTTTKDITNFEAAKVVIFALSEMVATRLRKYGLEAGGVSLGMRTNDLNFSSRQASLPLPTSNASDIANGALKLLKDNCNFTIPLRMLAVYTFKLSSIYDVTQVSMFDTEGDREKRLEESIDKIRKKYGYKSVQRAVLLNNDILNPDLHEEDDFLPFKR